jgi:uncharacterized protein (DUF1499 family)
LESRPQNARARKVPRSPSLSEEKAAVSVVQATSASTSHKAVHFAFQDSEIPFIDALGFEFALEDQVIINRSSARISRAIKGEIGIEDLKVSRRATA